MKTMASSFGWVGWIGIMLFAVGCGSNDSINQPMGDADPDLETVEDGDLPQSDGDNESESDNEIDAIDGDADNELSEESDKTETSTDGDEDTSTDGDQDPIQTDGDESEMELEQEDEQAEAEIADQEDDTETVEAETEIEEEATLVCDAETDPLDVYHLLDEPYFSDLTWSYEGEISKRCDSDGFIFAGARGMQVSIELKQRTTYMPLNGRLILTDIAAVSGRRETEIYFDQSLEGPSGTVQTSFTLPYSGEYLVLVAGRGNVQTGAYTLETTCTANCGRRFTRHPVVLMHGMAGFDNALGFYDYFYGVEADLWDRGYNVDSTEVAMFNDSVYRANEVERQLMEKLEDTGARKLNLVVHSQGGLDARHFISVMGHADDVSVLAMVATPNRGVILGDMVLGTVTGVSQDVIASIIDFFGNLIDASDSDIVAALGQISTAQMENEFNPAHPDAPNVEYWSWAGVTCGFFDFDCRDDHGGEYVGAALSLTYGLIKNGPEEEGYGPNDGMVPLYSAQWGTFMGIVNADHADEIGQLKSPLINGFDHKQLYRDIVFKLYDEGF